MTQIAYSYRFDASTQTRRTGVSGISAISEPLSRPPRLLAQSTLACLLSGLAVAIYVEIASAEVFNPIRATFSEYVYAEQGARLVGVAMLMVGFGALSAALALRLGGVPGARRASWMIGVFGVGLAALAVFPQEPAGVPLTWHGAIHRYVALAAFLTLPLGAIALARDRALPTRLLRGLATGSLITLTLLVVTFLPITDLVGARAVSGLVERVLLVLDLILLGAVAVRAARHGR